MVKYCKCNHVIPNFIKFKLFRKSLYNSEFYQQAVLDLLEIEINHKNRKSHCLSQRVQDLDLRLRDVLGFLNHLILSIKIGNSISKLKQQILWTQKKKLGQLGIPQPKFQCPDNVISNFSNYPLNQKEKHILSLGLNFKLPNFKPKFSDLFVPFEKLFFSLDRSLVFPANGLEQFKVSLQELLHRTMSKLSKPNWLPFFKSDHVKVLKKLMSNKDLVICRPDKGNGIVLLDKRDYTNKMLTLLSDTSKFSIVNEPFHKVAFRSEDKVNRLLLKLKNLNKISSSNYNNLHTTGSSFGILYGLPKIHKGSSVPLRPILAAYNQPNFKIAKFLADILSPFTSNQYTISNSFHFVDQVKSLQTNEFLVSFDVESLFTNIPLTETINIILEKAFAHSNNFHGLDRRSFKELLEIAVFDSYFIFNNTLYKQTDGCAMGSPLGPVFANIFMCRLEEEFLSQCPLNFRPNNYFRYVDDTFTSFSSPHHATLFLDFINSRHPNIHFTIDKENDNCLSFLDVLIRRDPSGFNSEVFRKGTFTGLGTNFYSFTPLKYKLNTILTLTNRAYRISANWLSFHRELEFLSNFFTSNSFPLSFVQSKIKSFLEKIFKPKHMIPSVNKMPVFISMPFLGFNQRGFDRELIGIFKRFFPAIALRIAPNNPLSISSLCKFKDSIPVDLRSKVVYCFNCPNCKMGSTYIGCTERHLRVRIDGHRGISSRTGAQLKSKEHSNIRHHALACRSEISSSDFKILATCRDKSSLLITESILIKRYSRSTLCYSFGTTVLFWRPRCKILKTGYTVA